MSKTITLPLEDYKAMVDEIKSLRGDVTKLEETKGVVFCTRSVRPVRRFSISDEYDYEESSYDKNYYEFEGPLESFKPLFDYVNQVERDEKESQEKYSSLNKVLREVCGNYVDLLVQTESILNVNNNIIRSRPEGITGHRSWRDKVKKELVLSLPIRLQKQKEFVKNIRW